MNVNWVCYLVCWFYLLVQVDAEACPPHSPTQNTQAHLAEHVENTQNAAGQSAEHMHCRGHACACIAQQSAVACFPSHQAAPVAIGPTPWLAAVTKTRAAKSSAAKAARAARASIVQGQLRQQPMQPGRRGQP